VLTVTCGGGEEAIRIARRITQLYQVKLNAALDRAADPAGLADYTYAQLRELLAMAERVVQAVAARREQADRPVTALRRAAELLTEQAEQAVLAGQEGTARQVVARRAAVRAEAAALGEQEQGLLAQERILVAAQRRLAGKIKQFAIQKDTIKAARTTAQARACIAQAFARIAGEVTDADLAAHRAADEATRLQARTRALDYPLTPAPVAISDRRLRAELEEISGRVLAGDGLAWLRRR
jgi:phage shock protein A